MCLPRCNIPAGTTSGSLSNRIDATLSKRALVELIGSDERSLGVLGQNHSI